MSVVSLDSPSTSGLAGTIKLSPSKHTVTSSMLGLSQVHFIRDLCMVCWDDKG
jgi:hypothetical protein